MAWCCAYCDLTSPVHAARFSAAAFAFCQLAISLTLSYVQLERDQAQQLHKQARAQLLICKENLQQKDEQLRPLREARDERNKAQEALRSSKGELPVKNEEELDARLKELHHRQQHESMSANSEKQLLQQIKALQVRF